MKAFQSKQLFNKIILCNESNPTEADFDEGNEIYKVLWMAHYYLWEDFGKIRIRQIKTTFSTIFLNHNYLAFRVNIQTNQDFIYWIIETNASAFRVADLIDLFVEKRQIMINAFKRIYGSNVLNLLSEKLAGTLNREQPLSSTPLYGEWIASEIEGPDYWPILSDRESIEIELLDPSYSISFKSGNICTIGGSHFRALRSTGKYDSAHNIVLANDGNSVLAFVVSLYKDTLKVILRYDSDSDGHLYRRGDEDLLIIKYKRVPDLKRLLERKV